MNSFLGRATLLKKNFFLGIFQGFCLKVSEDFFDRTPPSIFSVNTYSKQIVYGIFKIIHNYVNNKINN